MGLINCLYSVPSWDPNPTHTSVREVSDWDCERDSWHLRLSISWIILNKRSSEPRLRSYQIKLTNLAYRSLLFSPKAQTPLLPHPWKLFPLTARSTQQANILSYIHFPLLQISLLEKSQLERSWSSLKLKQLLRGGRCWSVLSLLLFLFLRLQVRCGPQTPAQLRLFKQKWGAAVCFYLSFLLEGSLGTTTGSIWCYKEQNPGAAFLVCFAFSGFFQICKSVSHHVWRQQIKWTLN